MPRTRVVIPPTAAAEPVTLADLAAQVRTDIEAGLLAAYLATPDAMPSGADPALWADLRSMHRKLRAARKKVEAHTQRLFAPATLGITYSLDEPYVLPVGAQPKSVSGFFSTLEQLATYRPEEYRKGITVNRELPLGAAFCQEFEVVAEVPADLEWLDLASEAILELAAEWYKNRETSNESNSSELPVSYRVKLAEARVTVLGFGG